MPTTDFSKQYNQSYIVRFNRMKELIMSNPCISEYNLPIKKLGEDILDECIVIAILFLDSKMKFSILRMNDQKIDNYTANSKLYIEDSTGKIPICFSKCKNKLLINSSGIILGFVGYKDVANTFICKNIIFPKPIEKIPDSSNKNDEKILFMSNITVNQSNYENNRLIIDYFYNKVNSIVICGNIYSDGSDIKQNVDDFNNLFVGINDFNTQIYLIPGPNDPTSHLLPQNPLHLMLFDQSLSNNLKSLPNPAIEKILGKKIMVINYEILKDLKKYSENEQNICDLDILEELVNIRLVAPNCPDTLGSVPFYEDDPFIINDCNYLICSGCTEFKMKKLKNVVIVCLPDFSKTNSVILSDFSADEFTEVILNY